jgi:general secretion pathway protein G
MVTITPIRNTNPDARDRRNPSPNSEPNPKPNPSPNSSPNPKPVISTGGGAFAAVVEKSASQLRPSPSPNRRRSESGFTLLELMIVMVVIGLLAAIAIPAYTTNIRHAREAVLKEDLHVLRQAIDSYTVDKQKAPQALDDLVQSGYIKVMPIDPFTHRSDTWMPVEADTLMSLDQTQSGIDDVHSGSQETAIDGTSYNTW